MYETFYRLSANPFRLVPDPRFCFAHAGHSEARAYLSYALKLGEGFILITGRPGTGKTTLVQAFLKEQELPPVVARSIVASNLKAVELLRAVAYAFGIDVAATDKATLRRRIQQFFARQVQAGNRVLLIIDEAQGLPQAALEELRLLADLQTSSRPLLQLFLVGQEKLRDIMRAPAMEQFQQRVIGTFRLEPLTVEQTRAYVEYRLCQAGWRGDPELTGAALLGIHRYSRGVPRHINKVCTRLFLHGLMNDRHRLDAEDVLAISAELHDEQLAPLGSKRGDFSEAVVWDQSPGGDGSVCLEELAVRYEKPQHDESDSDGAAEAGVVGSSLASSPGACVEPERRGQRRQSSGVGVAARQLAAETMDAARALRADIRETLSGTEWSEKRLMPFAVVSLAVLVAGISALVGHQTDLFAQQPGASPVIAAPTTHRQERRSSGNLDPAAAGGESSEHGLAAETTIVSAAPRSPEDDRLGGEADKLLSRAETQRTLVRSGTPAQVQRPISAGGAVQADTNGTAVASRPAHEESASPEMQPMVEVATAITASGRDTAGQEKAAQIIESGSEQEAAPAGMREAASATDRSGARTGLDRSAHRPDSVAASPTPTPRSRKEDRVAELLARAERSLARDRLLVPSWDDAYGYYREALELQPGNLTAIAGMGKIADRYVALVKRALERRDDEKARLYIQRGLRVQPGDPRLVLLRKRVDSMRSAGASGGAKPPLQPRPPARVPESREEPTDFLSRLKAFFTRNQSGEQDNP